ncbi:hypothetical protein CMI45_02840 [Candidatus Pacearchaeota archaeon]|nr:hypothetical protein [Candidatus Pacearchaeota archaeon]|tara:strand:+ start:1561 stop:2301 length:741 start_codon:yes stop_codon:yes gene_type:complete
MVIANVYENAEAAQKAAETYWDGSPRRTGLVGKITRTFQPQRPAIALAEDTSDLVSTTAKAVAKKVPARELTILASIGGASLLYANTAHAEENQRPSHLQVFEQDSDRVLLARMLFGEARSCSPTEKIFIAYTALNRARDGKRWNGETIQDSILCDSQYSCFNENDPNLPKIMDPESINSKAWKECYLIAGLVLKYSSPKEDPTRGATHYHTKTMKKYPSWAKSKKMKFLPEPSEETDHRFYREAA